MTRHPITVTKDASFQEAVDLCSKNNISCLPVVTTERPVARIVTVTDVIRLYYLQNHANRTHEGPDMVRA